MTKKKATSKTTKKTEEGFSHIREDNLLNESAEGKKATGLPANETVSPIDNPGHPSYIAPPSDDAVGNAAHMIRASRGEEVGHYQFPQSGIFNNTNLKA